MELSLKKALRSPISDEKWYLKIIFPSIMVILGNVGNEHLHIPDLYVIIVFLVSIIPNLILFGFFFQFQHNEIKNENPLLPVLKSNIFTYLKYGFKSLAFDLFYLFLIGLVIISLIIGLKLTLYNGIIKAIGTMLGITSFISLIFFYFMWGFAGSAYADNFSLKDAFNFSKNLNLISKVKSEILVFALYSLIIILFYLLLFYIFLMYILSIVLIPVLAAASGLMFYNLQAQFYKIAKFRLENNQITTQN